VPVQYRFEFRPETTPTGTGTNPFQLRTRDQGKNGWATVSGTPMPGALVFTNPNSPQPPTADIVLDGTGIPIFSANFAVGNTAGTPIANPTIPPGFDRAPESTCKPGVSGVYYQRWQNVPLIAFAGLNL
jgi:hypothetical protein